jgi:hypothetical protein
VRLSREALNVKVLADGTRKRTIEKVTGGRLRNRPEVGGNRCFLATTGDGVNQLADAMPGLVSCARTAAGHARGIRGPARRPAMAARHIKDLIQDSVKEFEDETVRVAQSAWTLEQIVAAANSARHHTVHAAINPITQE